MKTLLAAARKFSLFFAVVFLALLAAPAVAADAGSGTFVGTIDKKPVSITFKEVYAFRAEGSRKEQQIVVYLTDKPIDKAAMTAALKKQRKASALTFGSFLDGMAKAKLEIVDGKVTYLYLFSPPGFNLNLSGFDLSDLGKSDIKVNTAKRVEGRFFSDATNKGGAGKIDLRFAVDLADIGAPVEN